MGGDSTLITTRRSLHAVGELVLAGPQHAQTGEISLRVRPGGFGTTHTPDLRVDGTDVVGAEATVGITGLTPAALGRALGVEARGLADLYPDGSGVGLDDVLEVDPDAASQIAEAFAAGDTAMRALAADQTPILWPEHFDIGITDGEVNYGVSAGDTYLAVPYAYVGPWSVPTGDDFWNAPFGRALPIDEIPDLLTFFTEGRAKLGG